MRRTRVIPCLLLRGQGLVKTVRFRTPTYLGDPINIVRIFNDKEVDELVLLDILASVERRGPPLALIGQIASECFMPLAFGGGIRTVEEIQTILGLGVEKVSVNTAAVEDPELIRRAADRFGSQSIIASIDVRRTWLGGYEVVTRGARKRTGLDPVRHAENVAALGAGEILLTAVDRDGMMEGYDIGLLRAVTAAVSVPVVACGGAGKLADFGEAVHQGGASAVSAGSLFVYHGRHRAVLINFPSPAELQQVLP